MEYDCLCLKSNNKEMIENDNYAKNVTNKLII